MRARPCQGRGREFESRFPLQIADETRYAWVRIFRVGRGAWWQSGHAADCKSAYAGSIPTQASTKTIQAGKAQLVERPCQGRGREVQSRFSLQIVEETPALPGFFPASAVAAERGARARRRTFRTWPRGPAAGASSRLRAQALLLSAASRSRALPGGDACSRSTCRMIIRSAPGMNVHSCRGDQCAGVCFRVSNVAAAMLRWEGAGSHVERFRASSIHAFLRLHPPSSIVRTASFAKAKAPSRGTGHCWCADSVCSAVSTELHHFFWGQSMRNLLSLAILLAFCPPRLRPAAGLPGVVLGRATERVHQPIVGGHPTWPACFPSRRSGFVATAREVRRPDRGDSAGRWSRPAPGSSIRAITTLHRAHAGGPGLTRCARSTAYLERRSCRR